MKDEKTGDQLCLFHQVVVKEEEDRVWVFAQRGNPTFHGVLYVSQRSNKNRRQIKCVCELISFGLAVN